MDMRELRINAFIHAAKNMKQKRKYDEYVRAKKSEIEKHEEQL